MMFFSLSSQSGCYIGDPFRSSDLRVMSPCAAAAVELLEGF